jgi:thiamine biosynthesis lipoprotein
VKYPNIKLTALMLAAVLTAPVCTAATGDIYNYEFTALGTTISSQIKADNKEKAQFCANVVKKEVLRLEDLLSAYREDSDISRLGKSNGKWIKVSADTAEILEKTKQICAMTHGALDPTVGTLVKMWSVDHSNHRVPTQEEIAKVLPKVDWKKIEIKREGNVIWARIGEGQEITLGATGKGFIADKVAQRLRENGCNDALISLGGNIITLGTSDIGYPWEIGIQEPDNRINSYFAAVPSRDESVVTSGDYEKFFIKDGKKYHHILNPRTGSPVPATLHSVTIINKESALADGLCTALFVFGFNGAVNYLAEHPELKAVLVDEDNKNVVYTKNLENDFQVVRHTYRYGVIEPKKKVEAGVKKNN